MGRRKEKEEAAEQRKDGKKFIFFSPTDCLV